MAPVVRQLAQLPEEDVRAMARYLASFNVDASDRMSASESDETRGQVLVAQSTARRDALVGPAQRLFTTACGACHHEGDGPRLLGQNLPLALNTNLHSTRPDNLIRVILEGIREPASRDIGFMPAFRDALDDAQISELAAYLRARFAPDKAAWSGLGAEVARVRATVE